MIQERQEGRFELEKHSGCLGCKKPCYFNSRVARSDIASLSKGVIFDCNSSKRKEG